MMWYQHLKSNISWAALWYDLALCDCGAIRSSAPCQVCGSQDYGFLHEQPDKDGSIRAVRVCKGAEARLEDHLYLDLIQREWERPASSQPGLLKHNHISSHGAVVLLFWAYFESRIRRLLVEGVATATDELRNLVLQPHHGVGMMMGRLYRKVYGCTYEEDLLAVGQQDVAELLTKIQAVRNRFSHGNPDAITDEFATHVVSQIENEHRAFILVFNHRVAERRAKAAD